MLKYLAAVMAFIFCLSPEAFALVKQSASKALSYNNVASSSGSSFSSISGKFDTVKKTDTKETVTLTITSTASYSKTVTLKQDLKISLPKENYDTDGEIYWKVSYDNDAMLMTSNLVEGDRRNITFTFVKTGTSTIWIDKKDVAGATKRNIEVKVTVKAS